MRDLVYVVIPLLGIISVTGVWAWTYFVLRRVRDSCYHRGFERGYAVGQRDGRLEERTVRSVLPYRTDVREN